MGKANPMEGMHTLLEVTKKISLGDFRDARALFQLTEADRYDPAIAELAEAFGMMMVQVEARDLRLNQLIGQLRDKNEQLETAHRNLGTKNTFMTVLVHELKSPVATLKTLLETLEMLYPDDQRILKTSGRIGLRIDQLLSLISEILEISRANEAGQAELQELADLAGLTRKIFEEYKDQALAKGLSYEYVAPEAPVVSCCNPRLFQIIVSNLLSNAIKYTLHGGVRVEITSDGSTATINVSDTGIGIPEGDKQRLFEKFFRASNARRSPIRGTGIGLSNIREFLDRFGATLAFESVENRGTTFTLRLPLRTATEI